MAAASLKPVLYTLFSLALCGARPGSTASSLHPRPVCVLVVHTGADRLPPISSIRRSEAPDPGRAGWIKPRVHDAGPGRP
jgi:hypothetical protein